MSWESQYVKVFPESMFSLSPIQLALSSFTGKGKLKAYKKVKEKDSYQETFQMLDSDIFVNSYLFSNNTTA